MAILMLDRVLLMRADGAIYRAKEAGCNRVEVAAGVPSGPARRPSPVTPLRSRQARANPDAEAAAKRG